MGKYAVVAKTVNLTNETNKKLKDKIVIIENADPGYDYLFTKGVKGVITKFGGVNSHMSIRCSELKIPGAIGIGEEILPILRSLIHSCWLNWGCP